MACKGLLTRCYTCGIGSCPILGLLALFSWMIWHGNNIYEDDQLFKPGIAIEAECTVQDRSSDDCSCGRSCWTKKYTYRVTSPACPNVTLSSAKRHQKCKRKNERTYIDFGETETCYIDSCERANFVWNYRPNRRNGITFIVVGTLFVCSFGSALCTLICAVISLDFDENEKEYDAVNRNDDDNKTETVGNGEGVAMATTQT